jgi:hypothetical protein
MLFRVQWRFVTRAFAGICLPLIALPFVGCGVSGAPATIAIPAITGEDLSGPCRFEVSMANASHVQRGVLVLYERGDTDLLYDDAELRQTIAALDYSILWAYQCNAKSTGDIQADAAKGPARMLFAALDQLALKTNHPELSTNSIILYGFSAAGILAATMTTTHSARLIGAIQYAAGSATVDLDDVPISTSAAQIPALILANALDNDSGTTRSLHYFERGRAMGASWAYAVQNNTAHCCNLSTRSIILPWIETIASNQTGANSGTLNSFVCTPDGVVDAQGDTDCEITAASLSANSAASSGHSSSTSDLSGWVPNQKSGQAWLAWVTKKSGS